MATGAIIARILTQYSDKGSKAAAKDVKKLGADFDRFAHRAKVAFGIAAAASAALAIKIGKDAVQAAIADQKSQTLLANSLRNTAGATNSAIAGVEGYITKLQKQFSVVDDDLRPAMARLTAATGSITAAQSLMQTALDVSASSGADLATSVGAIIKATSGQFKALKTLVPALSNTTIKSKNVAKAFEEVNKATSGAATARAGTLEYRLAGLKIAYGEILETLGYALLPVMEKFATAISTKILPAIETWVALNKDRLAKSFQTAADFAVKLMAVALAFGDWVTNNTTTIQVLAGVIATMWAVGKIAAFVTAIKTVTTAMALLRTTAAGAAVASAFATGGVSAIAGGVAVAGILAAIGLAAPGTTANGSGKSGSATGGGLPKLGANGATSTGKNTSGVYAGNPNLKTVGTVPTVSTDQTLRDWLAALGKNTTAVTKNTKSTIDAVTADAIKQNLARQKSMSGSATIAIGGGGKLYRPDSGINVNIQAGNIIGSKDALVQTVIDGVTAASRRNGGGNSGGVFNGRSLSSVAV